MVGKYDAVSILFVDLRKSEEIFGTQFLVINVALDTGNLRSTAASFQVDAVHLQHVGFHEILVS
jgi:hypothetical protein